MANVNEKMTAIADAIRGLVGGTDLLSLDGMAESVSDYASRVCIKEVSFSDTNSITVPLPFKAEKVLIFSFNALNTSTPSTYLSVLFDNVSFSDRCATMSVSDSNKSVRNIVIGITSRTKYFAVSDSEFTLTPSQSSYWATSLWRGGKYLVVAYRSGKSERELLEAQIADLSDEGGEITFSQERVLEVVTEEEWQTLIATKPNWTFTLS